MNEPYLLIIDGSSLLSTQFFGNLPREILFAKTPEEKEKHFSKIMMTRTGVYTNAVYGFLRVLFKILKDNPPSHLAVTWDLSRDTFRRELYPAYKGTRQDMLKPLKEQFVLCQDVLRKMGIAEFMDERYEADDFSGSLAKRFEHEVPVKILTKDHDYLQLVNENTHLWLVMTSEDKTEEFRKKYGVPAEGLPEKTVELDPDLVKREFLVRPEEIPALKGLQGDSSDNIPGVPGIGPKTAAALIARYGSIDALYRVLTPMTPEKEAALKTEWKALGITRSPLALLMKTSETELVGEASARLSEELATIDRDVDLGNLSLSDLSLQLDEKETERILDELEIRSLSTPFHTEKKERRALASVKITSDLSEAYGLLKTPNEKQCFGVVLCEGTGLAVADSEGNGVFFREEGFLNRKAFSDILRGLTGALFVSDGKDFYRKTGLFSDDVSVMAYLLDPLQGSYEVPNLVRTVLKEELPAEPDPEALLLRAFLLCSLGVSYREALENAGMTVLYETVERPTVPVLADMEDAGILVNPSEMRTFSESLLERIRLTEDEIYELSGGPFNIQSPKQLGEVLFEKLTLPHGKKTKSGYSTSADVLERLRDEHPVIPLILDYRTYQKLRSTYAEALQDAVSQKDGRIHCRFNQTVTATGRISSSDPNLQNIPVRTELGRSIRKMFVPKPGFVFIDADYSQIELRILAHLSGDKTLIDAYNHSADIHTLTASQVFKIPMDQVTAEERRRAKAVNFGIVYGISAFSLSEDLSISYEEAASYRNAYFETYPGVKAYLDRAVKSAVETGVSRTLFGRIRPIPELSSSNFNQRSFGERVAMNAPIQGTAADIMKLAVIRVSEALKAGNFKSRMVLQVHDEILVEAAEEEADEVEKLLISAMEGVSRLTVELKVEAKRGRSWYETK